ncbi:MAG: riboflavin synthase [Gammaproteobacteria bacterium]|nr:riboflavin synthase [Gammaproteobacteria bacterium]MCY4218542.1 riboflavin synthase [Gammaproteobacteria bacterium]
MFTGIIQTKGIVVSCDDHDYGKRLDIEIVDMPLPIPQIGDSIAVNGTCLTVIEINNSTFRFDVSSETLHRTLIHAWRCGDRVNIEKALTLSTPLGGHLVSGHIDGIGTILFFEDTGSYRRMRIRVDKEFAKFLAHKGSVTIDGISLTVNSIFDDLQWTEFDLMLVPHTVEQTTLGELSIGDSVHIEVDQIARYIHRMESLKTDKTSD